MIKLGFVRVPEMLFEEFLNVSPYSLKKEKKEEMLTRRLLELTGFHRQHCREYDNILNSLSFHAQDAKTYSDIPFLPVRIFKEMDLKSVPDKEVVKTMTSSGTSGQAVSRIYLDRITASSQQKAMVKIVSDFTGSGRMPMIIVDCPSVVKDRKKFSARGAGILGFSIFGTKKIYALDDDMKLDTDGLRNFLETYRGQKILLFGFTFMIWQHFYKELVRLKAEGTVFDLSNGVMIHGGGWKKLQAEAVGQEEFLSRMEEVCGLNQIHDYYGMVEQTGCIYMQCEYGHLHASVFSDVIARRPEDFSVCGYGEPGILQVVSAIPESYPGHSLLTEDEGVILGEDDCPCGRKGKYFKIIGRMAKAEIRGCSDTYAADYGQKGKKSDAVPEKSVLLGVSFLVGSERTVREIRSLPPKRPFDEDVLEFLNALSKELMSVKESRQFPDIVTLGFWLRKSSLLSLKERFTVPGKFIIGRGTAFHIAPSNVPVNYAYSLFTGLICGNANIVRVPSKDFMQIGIINGAICKLLEQERFSPLKGYINLVRYDRNKDINDFFSSICDVRIVWGGDSTIGELRRSPLSPRAAEVVFADRYSLAVIDSDAYMDAVNIDCVSMERIASDFYNDTYLSDQNACTSPRVVIWMGNRIQAARELFWDALMKHTKQKYRFQPIQGVDKLSNLCLASAGYIDASGKTCIKALKSDSNLLQRIEVSRLDADLMDYRGNSGYFYEYELNDVQAMRNFCDNTHCQTIACFGDRKMLEPLIMTGIRGVDRIVPVGHTMDFDFEWDGYNLVNQLTRTIAM